MCQEYSFGQSKAFNPSAVMFRNSWHSFDRTPWKHPWLTVENLNAMQEFSKDALCKLRGMAEGMPAQSGRSPVRTAWKQPWHVPNNLKAMHGFGREALAKLRDIGGGKRALSGRYGFVCNIANSMYTTAKALRGTDLKVDILMHPHDDYLFSQPEWEEYADTVPDGVETYSQACQRGIQFAEMPNVIRTTITNGLPSYKQVPAWVQTDDYHRWREYYYFLPTITEARKYDCLFAIQCPYLAYLSGRPYVATHMGGDIWYECSRDDQLGQLQRHAFSNAAVLIASNPWSYAFARRYGFRNLLYLPTLLDPADYSPGPSDDRALWQSQTNGNFFVLSTARVDESFKGSGIALEGFSRFCQAYPGARLIMIGWGNDLAQHRRRIEELGLSSKLLVLPRAGKNKLISYLRSADCLLDQFTIGYFGMTALEAMACGLPVIMRLATAQFSAFSEAGAPPVFNASSAGEVADALARLASDQHVHWHSRKQVREWFIHYGGNARWSDAYRDLFYTTAIGYRIDFSASPLNAPVTEVEIDYHRTELECAPGFPNYF
jgi:glycosyltransferase involved in cell wall biosynthesis